MVSKGLSSFRKERDGMVLACCSANMEDALQNDPEEFDIILLDLMIPGTDPEENLKALNHRYPGKKVIILTSQENASWEIKMYKLGVKAFLLKTIDRKALIRVIKQVYAGHEFEGKWESIPAPQYTNAAMEMWEKQLKPVEKAILKYLADDIPIKQIAEKTGKSSFMVYRRLFLMRKRVKVSNNFALLKFFREILF